MTEKKRRGPGRPFKPGQSGNPHGTTTGARPRALLALDALAEGRADAIVDAMATKAIEGDTTAAALILSRVWPQRRGRPTPMTLPAVRTAADLTSATAELVAAMAAGELSPEEAQAAATVLQAHRTALETAELEARIAALEAAKGVAA